MIRLCIAFGCLNLLLIPSCLAPMGRLDEQFSRSVTERVQRIDQLDLSSKATDSRSGDAFDSFGQSQEPARTTAGVPEQLSIDRMRQLALANNLDLEVVLLDPALAGTVVSEEEAKFDATIVGGLRYKRSDLPRLDGDLVELTADEKTLDKELVKLTAVEQQKDQFEFEFGIDAPMPTGGKVKLRNLFDERNKLAPERFDQYVSALKFSFSQPLLRGAGIDANVASIRLARIVAKSVAAKTKLSMIRILAAAEKAYWRVYAANKVLDIRRQQYDLAFENLDLVRKRVEEGLTPEVEIARAEVGVTRRRESVILAETAVRLQERDLTRMLQPQALSLTGPWTMQVATEPNLQWYPLDPEALAQEALNNRMELLELELDLTADSIRVDYARNQALPNFLLDFQYGILDRQGSFGTAWQGSWDFDNSEFAIGGRAEIPVTNQARRSALQRAILARLQRLATRQQRETAIRQEVYDAVDVFNQNWQRIVAARQNVAAAGVNYEAERAQFDQGLRTMREVLEALALLGEAQLKEINAIVAFQSAQVDLAYATGTLLGYAKLGLEPMRIGPVYD